MRKAIGIALLSLVVIGTVGCATHGQMHQTITVRDFDPPVTPGGPPVLKTESVYDLSFVLPEALEALKNFTFNAMSGIKFRSMDLFDLSSIVSGTTYTYIGIALLLAGGIIAGYFKLYVPGAIFIGVGLFCLVAPTVLPVLSGIFIILLVLAIGYVIGKYVFHLEFKQKGQSVSNDLAVEGDTRAAIAVKRVTDPSYNAKFPEIKKTLKIPKIPKESTVAPATP